MNVNRDSWHYKLAHMISDYGRVPNNLCAYFWRVILGGFVFSLLLCVAGVVIVCVASIGMQYLYPNLFPLAVGGGIAAIFALVVILTGLITARKEKESYECNEDGERIRPEPNIVWEYLKAKKQKVCPLLEFV